MTVRRLLRIDLNVADLDRAQDFYVRALGCVPLGGTRDGPSLARLLGVRRVHSRLLSLGGQRVELTVCDPPGLPYPADTRSGDSWYQHLAVVTDDIAAAVERLRQVGHTPITHDGPQRLADGAFAYRVRDPDGHPLELRQPAGNAGVAGIDHAAISVADIGLSVTFYEQLGLSRALRQTGAGAEQDRLDASVEVVEMSVLNQAAPRIALLGYCGPPARSMVTDLPDLVSTRLVFEGDTSNGDAAAMFDPDGHALLIVPNPEPD